MSTILSLLFLLVFLSLGFAAGRLRILKDTPLLGRVFSLSLYALMLSMGLRLGQSREVLSRIPEIGAMALVGALGSSLGTVLAHLAATPIYRRLPRLPVSAPSSRGASRARMLLLNLRKPLFLLLLVVAGTLLGALMPVLDPVRDGTVSTWILYLLLGVIGVQMAHGTPGLARMLLNPAIVAMPAVTVIGTLIGSLPLLAFSGISLSRALAMGSGFGWYSLSGVLIADRGEPLLGAAAFLANLLRESVAFLSVPALRSTGRYEAGVGICGATSMDVTLPVIEDAWGPSLVPVSVAHGVILSFLVPFLVPLFMSF